ncbi:MAG: S9 family peptidase [Phycisphaerae bacterium]|nr:S9 family peptidase [Phycisphaerae bacterium]
MRISAALVVSLAALSTVASGASPNEPPAAKPTGQPLISRSTLFGNPDRASVQISPDGKHISYLSALDGVLNVFVAPADKPGEAKAVTKDTNRGIRQYFWAFNGTHLLYLQDKGGDENWNLFSVDVASGASKNLTPFEDIPGPDGKPMNGPDGRKLRPTARVEHLSPKFPDEILVGLNTRSAMFHDVHRINLKTGEIKLAATNEGYAEFVCDDDFNVRLASKQTPQGGTDIFKLDKDLKATPFTSVPMEDSLTTSPGGFGKSPNALYMVDSRGRNTAALTLVGIEGNKTEVIAEDPRADVGEVVAHPTGKYVQAVAFNYDRKTWKVIDKSIQPDLDYLKGLADGDVSIGSRSLDDKAWIVSYLMDDGPVKYFFYDRPSKKATFLFSNRKSLEGLALAKMHPRIIKSRDGLDLVSYLSLPPASDSDKDGRPEKPLPMVLLVHGGPWARDSWGYNGLHQWLANRGYAVLSVNFRGSTGLGKNFVNAGNKEWAGKMHDDLIDAVNWAVENKVADKSRVAIMGGSYGGYATLVGLTFTPDTFACGVDIVGPSNIVTLLNTIPPYWQPMVEQFAHRVGDHRTEDGRKFLDERSPLNRVDRIKKPLLIGQGANDPRVKQAESDQIVRAMKDKNIPVTYVLFPDEGHGFARPENNKSFFAVTEAFLSQHLGGSYEPIGNDFKGSSITVPHGDSFVPGLTDGIGSKPVAPGKN